MDFQSINSLNVWMNMISGNLLPMTADNTPFPIFWKIYSVLVWLLLLVHAIALIYGSTLVPKKRILKDTLVSLIISAEVTFMVIQIHARRRLVSQLIEKLNEILSLKKQMIKNTTIEILKPIEIPLKFFWMSGVLAIILWSSSPYILIFERNYFFYADYKMPVFYAKEPFSTSIFLLGNFIVTISNIYSFTKKISIDSYMIHMILLITAQYKYITNELSAIFQGGISCNSNSKERYSDVDYYTEKEIKSLCWHHNLIMHVTLMLKDLLSLNLNLIYMTSIFRLCCIALLSVLSTTLLEMSLVITYALGAIVQLYILCSCVQQLLDAGTEITDKAFHEEWYRYGKSVKYLFVMLIIANNLNCKLSKFEKLNLSLPSFMTILNSSYTIALLLLRIN